MLSAARIKLFSFLLIISKTYGLLQGFPNLGMNGSLTFNQSEIESQIAEGQISCPTFLPNIVLQYLTTTISDINSFRNVELPPFLQVRFPNSPGNAVVREYIKTQFQTLGWQVEEDPSIQTTPLGLLPFVNVIATWNPQISRRIVLACHYDSKFLPAGFIGAVDAAVPCAMLVDLAKRLSNVLEFIQSTVSIQMIFFDGEEPFVDFTATDSLYGSRNLAAVWANTLDPNDETQNRLAGIEAFILLDVIGHSETQFQRYFPGTNELYTQLLIFEACLALNGQLLRPLPLSRQIFQNSIRETFIIDDHIPFQQQGVNVMHLIGFPFPTAWHTLQDNANILDYTIIEDLNRILRCFVANYYLTNALAPLYQAPST